MQACRVQLRLVGVAGVLGVAAIGYSLTALGGATRRDREWGRRGGQAGGYTI